MGHITLVSQGRRGPGGLFLTTLDTGLTSHLEQRHAAPTPVTLPVIQTGINKQGQTRGSDQILIGTTLSIIFPPRSLITRPIAI